MSIHDKETLEKFIDQLIKATEPFAQVYVNATIDELDGLTGTFNSLDYARWKDIYLAHDTVKREMNRKR